MIETNGNRYSADDVGYSRKTFPMHNEPPGSESLFL